ncbi:MAG TPA: N-acetylmuramoyl-L-alanine amidase [Xanthobacteraceae bacterium]|jgi:N-acetylmuramoyl-L-alanine amidase|nr:N-acetylmuramoyl-L-alanine amidase [Xanthobacteraceae bacterium]
MAGFCATKARKARDMMNPRHAGTVLLGALAALLVAAAARPAWSEEPAPAVAVPAHSNCQPSAFRVVVDVGHTLDVPGALSARGMPEYAFNLQLAQQIKQTLVGAGFDKTVLLITTKAPPAGLFERAMIANRLPADLFISIHHDSVPDKLMQTWQYDGKDQQYNDDYPGYALFISNDNADRAGSLQFGKFLGKALQARGLQFTPHYTLALMGNRRRELLDADAGVYRYDQLVVLRYTRMPALLLEAGSIVNRQEELELATPERRTLTSEAVAAAVEDFCAARAHPKIEQLVKRPANPRTAGPKAVAR